MVSEGEDRKRSSADPPPLEENTPKKIKRSEDMEGTSTKKKDKGPFNALLAVRIKSYLEANRMKKFVDIDDMAQTLYDDHDEYRSKKFKAFKSSVEKTFQNLKNEFAKLSSSKKPKQPVPEVRTPDETTAKTSVNARLTNLYKKSSDEKPKTSPNNDDSDDNDEHEIIVEPVAKASVEVVSLDSEEEKEKEIKEEEETEQDTKQNQRKAEKIESKRRESSDKKNYISGKKVREQTELNCDEERDEPNHAKPNHEASISNGSKKVEQNLSEVVVENGSSDSVVPMEVEESATSDEEKQNGVAKEKCLEEKQNGFEEKDGVELEPVKELLSDFERIKRSAMAVKVNIANESGKATKTRPSKSLSNYLNKAKPEESLPESTDNKTNEEVILITSDLETSGQTTKSGTKFSGVPSAAAKKAVAASTKAAAASTKAAASTPNADICDTDTPRTKIDAPPTPRTSKTKRTAAAGDEGSGAKKRKNTVEVQTSSSRFADFGGNDSLLCDICKLLAHLKHPEIYRELGVTPPRGFLLHGPPGCGKTLLAHAIVGELGLPFIKIAAPEIVSGVSGDSESKIRDLFKQAEDCSPCVLFIDEIDSITPKRENAAREMERRIVAQLLTCLDELGKGNNQVVVIGATNRPDSLDPALRRAGRFDREIALGIPDRAARLKILNVLSRDLRLSDDVIMKDLAALTPGYVGADLSSLVREAAIAAVNRMFNQIQDQSTQTELNKLLEWLRDTPPLTSDKLVQLFIQQSDFKAALKIVQPSAKREGFATVPGVSWADVGALADIREELQLSILAPVRFQEEFETLGLPASSGVLLAGPPGCGKTLVAKAIANEAGINFISVKGPELLNMYVGESERAVRACFQRARNSSPCVIFFDEIDSLCPRRSGNSSDGGSSSRVVNQLLTEMDGVEVRNGVFLMAATNRPDILDPAVLRPGRLDKVLYVGFPGPQDRVEILTAVTKNGTKPRLDSSVSLTLLGRDRRCEGFSGADMSALVREASMAALKEALRSTVRPSIAVGTKHFEQAFSCLKPSVGDKDRAKYLVMEKRYARNNKDDLPGDKVDLHGKTTDLRVEEVHLESDAAEQSGVEIDLTPSNAFAELGVEESTITDATENTHTTLASEKTNTTPASKETNTTPASNETNTTPASNETNTTPASDNASTKPASVKTNTTAASKVANTTTPVISVSKSLYARAPANQYSEMLDTTLMVDSTMEVTEDDSSMEVVEDSSVEEERSSECEIMQITEQQDELSGDPKVGLVSPTLDDERSITGLPPTKENCLSVCSTTIWVGHLSRSVNEDVLSGIIKTYGEIKNIHCVPPRGCAFVCMKRRADAHRTLIDLNGYSLHGKRITLNWAPGKGLKDKQRKDFWDVKLGVSYIPLDELDPQVDLAELEEGGMIDEESVPVFMKRATPLGEKAVKDLITELPEKRVSEQGPENPIRNKAQNGQKDNTILEELIEGDEDQDYIAKANFLTEISGPAKEKASEENVLNSKFSGDRTKGLPRKISTDSDNEFYLETTCDEDFGINTPTKKPEVNTPSKKPEINTTSKKPEVNNPSRKPVVDTLSRKPVVDTLSEKPEINTTSKKPEENTPSEKLGVDAHTKKPEMNNTSKKPEVNTPSKKPEEKSLATKNIKSSKPDKPCSSLRFLPLMMIRVCDNSKVLSAAGKTGQVKNTRKNSKVTVRLEGIVDGSLGQRIVDLAELEPFMPEEGDQVKLLLHATREDVGEVLRMDEEDVCEVRFKDGIHSYQIDHLCKISQTTEN